MDRSEQLHRLQEEVFDVVIIGGGSVGSGVAVDAASRGLRVALIEARDFAAGTSSRSTKLLHGGVRYLEKAVWRLDRLQYLLVRDALLERSTAMKNAPHLCRRLPILTPLYSWWEIPYYWLGLKFYDWLSGERSLGKSEFVSTQKALELVPTLRDEGLKGAVLYYDGQFDDARFNLSLALTAHEQGAAIANHLRVEALQKEKDKVVGVEVRDTLSGERFAIRGRQIINATGPLSDHIRLMDHPRAASLITASAGTHIVLDGSFARGQVGLLIPHTPDGRVLFMLPWQGKTLAGTTDVLTQPSENPQPSEGEQHYILSQLGPYLHQPLDPSQIQAVWTGLRPLVRDSRSKDTQELLRDHLIQVSGSGLLTIVGGKWTSYRSMSADVVDRICQNLDLGHDCISEDLPLRGAEGYSEDLGQRLELEYNLPPDVASHLAHSYGGHAREVCALLNSERLGRLDEGYPYLEAEVLYTIRHEMACTADDILSRRMRLAFLDRHVVDLVRGRVVQLMAQELGWSEGRRAAEMAQELESPLSPKAS